MAIALGGLIITGRSDQARNEIGWLSKLRFWITNDEPGINNMDKYVRVHLDRRLPHASQSQSTRMCFLIVRSHRSLKFGLVFPTTLSRSRRDDDRSFHYCWTQRTCIDRNRLIIRRRLIYNNCVQQQADSRIIWWILFLFFPVSLNCNVNTCFLHHTASQSHQDERQTDDIDDTTAPSLRSRRLFEVGDRQQS